MLETSANIRIADFDYPLSDDRIAKHPISQRDRCRLLVRDANGNISHHIFSELPQFIPSETLLICNNTRVINARLRFQKSTGATVEIFCLEPIDPIDYAQMFQTTVSCRWSCLVGNLKRWKAGKLQKIVALPDGGGIVNLTAERIAPREGNAWEIEFCWDNPTITFASLIEAAGYIPIPPYLNRESEASDSIDYQTIYSKIKGSVAAPTAGLHFTDEVFENLRKNGVCIRELTLHVGAGTFQPVKSETIREHPMHTEVFTISKELIDELVNQKKKSLKVFAVGTTSVRTLESLPYLGASVLKNPSIAPNELYVDQWDPYKPESNVFATEDALLALRDYMSAHNIHFLTASTSIMIAPGFQWRVVDGIVTNFHQPQSTLLLLVSSFVDAQMPEEGKKAEWRKMYDEALSHDYRFLSYGDSSLLLR